MLVRPATCDDVAAIIAIGRVMHAESLHYSRYPYDERKLHRLALGMLEDPNSILLVAEQDEIVVGVLAGFVSAFYFSSARSAADLILYVLPEHRGSSAFIRLVGKFETAAIARRANEVVIAVSAEIDAEKTIGMLERLGYQNIGGGRMVMYV
jgi:hypothetical protein